MATAQTVLETSIDELPLVHRGKVRDIYKVTENELLMVATDRLSAFDCVLPTPIPRKGEVLTQLSAFWFRKFEDIDNHFITADFVDMPAVVRAHVELRAGSILVRRDTDFTTDRLAG